MEVDLPGILGAMGGVAPRREILRHVTRRRLERGLDRGEVVRVSYGRYALPTADRALTAAGELTGTVVLVSAAAHWGWSRIWEPRRPQVAVPRGRKVAPGVRERIDVRWRSVPAGDLRDGVTTPLRTLVDCAVLLPFREALAVTDSALRCRAVSRADLLARVEELDPQLRPRVRRVFVEATPKAANPMESALRAIALDVVGLAVRPQVRVEDATGFVGVVDLADPRLGIVLEAEGMEFHGERALFDRDCLRYDRLVADGWLVLRFSWTMIMTQPEKVRDLIERTVALRLARAA